MTETEYSQTVDNTKQEGTLLDRLKRIKESTDKVQTLQVGETVIKRDDTQFTNEFSHTVNVLKSKAKTEAFNNRDIDSSERLRLINLLNIIVIVPDEVLADVGKDEINITPFVRRFLPETEWEKYIPKINL